MQAATAPERSLAGDLPTDRATRIVEAMRASVAQRGIAGSTFHHVAREAGVSRGLLHYYFGTKERLLVEVVRRESELRSQSLDQAVASATGADELIHALVRSLEEILGEGRSAMVMFHELLTLGQRNPEIARPGRNPAHIHSPFVVRGGRSPVSAHDGCVRTGQAGQCE